MNINRPAKTFLTNSFLTNRFFSVYGLWQIVGALCYIRPELLIIYVGGLISITALVYIDRKSLLQANEVRGQIQAPTSFELGEKIKLQLHLDFPDGLYRSPSEILWLSPVIAGLNFTRGQQKISAINFTATADAKTGQLGYYELKTVKISSLSQFRLWRNTLHLNITALKFRIHPQSKKLLDTEFSERVSRQSLFHSGVRRQQISRGNDQFYSIRRYQYPDSKRHIDAKKSARYNQLMTRNFEEYRSHHLVIALDVSRNMLGFVEASPKMDFYLSAALKLAEVATGHGDEVSLFSFSDQIHLKIPKARSLFPLDPIFRGHRDVRTHNFEADYSLLLPCVAELAPQRSILLVLTDTSMPAVHEKLTQNLQSLCLKHFVVVAGLMDKNIVLDKQVLNIDPMNISRDEYSQLIWALNVDHKQKLLQAVLNHWGGGLVSSDHANWLGIVTKSYQLLRQSSHS